MDRFRLGSTKKAATKLALVGAATATAAARIVGGLGPIALLLLGPCRPESSAG